MQLISNTSHSKISKQTHMSVPESGAYHFITPNGQSNTKTIEKLHMIDYVVFTGLPLKCSEKLISTAFEPSIRMLLTAKAQELG